MSDSRGSSAAPGRRRRTGLRVLLALLVLALVAGVVLVVREVRSPAAVPTATPTSPPAAPTSATPTPTPTATATPTPSSSTPAEPTFDRARLSLDDPTSSWVVVNKARPLSPVDHVPTDLVSLGGRYQLRAEAAQAMQAMLAGAAADGLTVTVQSAYRSYDYQVDLFRAQVARFGEEQAEIQVARPGTSEHQTGLAADVGGGGCDIDRCFGANEEGRWVAAHAAEYGYVVRYPEGETDVTGYRYEPWHVRYVGVELATELQRTGTATLEEFFGLPPAPDYPG
ncbi:D-alanyl-D-alanine carboxypeptidase family protein [Modestobacter sp. SSW1-42]|uniref:M15 family metallopeptidase n=1 Tax=Modestobacter sp. SSW1-42 TaxID=596372 RepID=UPI0039862811